MNDVNCGYCYLDLPAGPSNSTCVPIAAKDNSFAAFGRCNITDPPNPVTWAYDYCPTSYSWMAFVGLIAYLAFFAPGKCF